MTRHRFQISYSATSPSLSFDYYNGNIHAAWFDEPSQEFLTISALTAIQITPLGVYADWLEDHIIYLHEAVRAKHERGLNELAAVVAGIRDLVSESS